MSKHTPRSGAADKQLKAAAPALLKACRIARSALLPLIEGMERHEVPIAYSAIDEIDAAIAKAEGKD